MGENPVIIVMGVAGTGKSTLGRRLAAELGLPFVEGDDLHSPRNLQKLRSGIPLGDADREPWLGAIVDELNRRALAGTVVSCSALKRAYRDKLRTTGRPTIFVHLTAPEAVLRARLERRPGHFISPSLLPSQLRDLQPPSMDEDYIELDASLPTDAQVREVLRELKNGDD